MNNIALYVVVVLIWGSTWLAIEFQLGVVPAEESVFYRFVLATLILFAYCGMRRSRLRFGLRAHAKFAQLGFLLFSINYLLAYNAQRFVPSAMVAIAFSMIIWMNIVNMRIFFGVRSGGHVIFGALLGVCGICLMFWPSIDHLALDDAAVTGALLGIAGSYVASLGNMVSQSAQRQQLPVLQSNAWGMLYGAGFTGIIILASGDALVFDTSLPYVLSLIYLSVFGSIVAFGAYLLLLGRIGAHKAGYATVMFPVVALILSVTFEGMKPAAMTLLGILLALAGNYFVMRKVTGKSRPAPGLLPKK